MEMKRKNKGIGVTPHTEALWEMQRISLSTVKGGAVHGHELLPWLLEFAAENQLLFRDHVARRLGIPRAMPEPGPDDGQPVPLEKLPY